jgi:uncharacterized membrane protein
MEMNPLLENSLLGLWAGGAFLLVAFIPGLAFSYWLFPGRALDYLDRFFIAIAASIALSSLTGSILAFLPSGLNPLNFMIVIGLMVVVSVLGYFYRSRPQQPYPGSDQLTSQTRRPPVRRNEWRSYLIWGMIVSIIAILIHSLAAPTPFFKPQLTEFYFSPNFLQQLTVSPPKNEGRFAIPVQIANKEGRDIVYRVEAWAEDTKVGEQSGIGVQDGKTWREAVIVDLSKVNKPPFIDLKLFSNAAEAPIAQLRLWLQLNSSP